MIQSIIIDDEAKNIKLLQNMLAIHCPQIQVIASTSDAPTGIKLINEWKPPLVFLDVEMPQLNGFDVLKELEPVSFETIFVTAYSHYAIAAFEHHATGYITKPINSEKLVAAVTIACKRIEEKISIRIYFLYWNKTAGLLHQIKFLFLPAMDWYL
jgi:two-component system LytT family response regulator